MWYIEREKRTQALYRSFDKARELLRYILAWFIKAILKDNGGKKMQTKIKVKITPLEFVLSYGHSTGRSIVVSELDLARILYENEDLEIDDYLTVLHRKKKEEIK